MKLTTRNLLAELILDALDKPVVATAVDCLAAYAQLIKATPPVISQGQLLLPAVQGHEPGREHVLSYLEGCELLAWRGQARVKQVTLAPDLIPECADVTAKLSQYRAALGDWTRVDGQADITLALRKGALLFNHHLFFEVHEVLEAQWVQEVDPERRFLQGLIQIGVALYHQSNGNWRGTVSLLNDGLDKIKPYAPAYLGVEVAAFAAELETCREQIERLGPEGIRQFQTEKIPQMGFLPEASSG